MVQTALKINALSPVGGASSGGLARVNRPMGYASERYTALNSRPLSVSSPPVYHSMKTSPYILLPQYSAL